MTEVLKDAYWQDVATFINKTNTSLSDIYGPDEFQRFGLRISPLCNDTPLESHNIYIVHKGVIDAANIDLFRNIISSLWPVFANEVFVVFTKKSGFKQLKEDDVHLSSLAEKLANHIHKALPQGSPSRQRTSIYLGGYRAITTTIYGHKILVDTRDLSLAPHILLDGFWEQWNTKVFLQLIQPGMRVVEVGANIGFYSILAAQNVGPDGFVTCFEAHPTLADLTFHTLHMNGFNSRTKVINKAVYNENTELNFSLYENYLASSSIWAQDDHAALYHDKLKVIKVEAVTLDSQIGLGENVDLIKIDAEGAEPYILQGASRILSENDNIKIMMEFAPRIIEGSYGDIAQFYDATRDLGFTVKIIMPDSSLQLLKLEDLADIDVCDVVLSR